MRKTWMPTTAGILSIVAGGLSILVGLIIASIASIALASANYTGPGDRFWTTAWVWLIFLPFLIISVVAIVGGIYSLHRRMWGLALAGAICSFFTLWAWALGVAAIVLVAISRPEFDHHDYPPVINIPPP